MVRSHNRYFSRPHNFAIFEGINSKFGKLGYFDMFIKVSVFHKYCNFYDFSQTEPEQNDVIRRYTEQVSLLILFLSTETDYRMTRKLKLL